LSLVFLVQLRAEILVPLAYESGELRDASEEQLAVRLERMRSAVRTLLECVGEDVDREGLHDTPSRYAKTLLFMTKGYHVNAQDVVNNALFSESHEGIVIVKDIEIFSLCEHHLVPFTGKVRTSLPQCDCHVGCVRMKAQLPVLDAHRLCPFWHCHRPL
jgi:GTP cyclohydrolase IA